MFTEPTKVPRSRTLGSSYPGRNNAFNLIRLVLALAVLVGHSNVLAFGRDDNPLRLPADLGGLAVTGFFALSGFLITRSGRRTPFLRYWWHRVLRIYPGLWACLLLTALVVGPLLWTYRHGALDGYWSTASGPMEYLRRNLAADPRQDSIGDVLAGRANPALNGSLWTLKYELGCYAGVSVLALIGVLRRARPLILVPTLLGTAVIVADQIRDTTGTGRWIPFSARLTVPVAGTFLTFYLLVLATSFLLGACAELYRDRVPLNDALGAASLAVVLMALYLQLPLLGPALPAYVYLLLWLGIRLPAVSERLSRVGRRNDYSYGVYIYAFLVQQTLAVYGVYRFGEWPYMLICMGLTLLLAAASWHFIEKPALRLKEWTPSLRPFTANPRWMWSRERLPVMPARTGGVR
ncbi:acyltransferase family protein [Dactylosporangium sp. NPDC048998]|uniref:acyltransferase family protein n=1 Tax=Dactylosporangium sp. NPDC048998 TaxID=3363976 RepID=UPI00371CD3EB